MPERNRKLLPHQILSRRKRNLKINLPADWKNYDVLYVTVKDKTGKEILTKSFPIIRPSYLEKTLKDDEGIASSAINGNR